MTHEAGTLVQQSANNPSTGTFQLASVATGRQSFVSAIGNGNTCFYIAVGVEGAEWGIGTVASGTPDTLARTTVIWTSAGSTAKLDFSGTVDVFQGLPSEYGIFLDPAGDAGPALATYNAAADRLTFNLLRATTGILFGTDTADANKLDKYAETTSTSMKVADASSGGNESPTTVNLRATQIGRIVIGVISVANIDTTGLTAGNDVFLTGLPWTPAGLTALGILSGASMAFAGNLAAYFAAGQSYVQIAETASGAARDFVTVGELTDDAADLNIVFIIEV